MPRVRLAAVITIACLGLAIALLAWAATAPPDGKSLVDEVSRTYRGLDQYDFAGTVTLRVNANGTQQSFDIPMRVAHQKPGHEHVEMRHPMMGVMVVSDGAHTTTWLAQTNRYVTRDVTPPPDSLGNAAPAGSPIARYFNLGSNMKSARVTGEQRIPVGGATADTWVLEVVPDAATAMGGDSTASAVSTLWIDKTRHVVLRDSTHIHSSHSPMGGGVLDMTQTIAISQARVNEPVPDTLFAFHAPEGAQQAADPSQLAGGAPTTNLTGQQAADFTLKDTLGRPHKLSAYRGKVVMLDFWATWCGPCRIEMPTVQKLSREFRVKGLVTFAVNVGETVAKVKPFLVKNGYTMSVLLDPDQAVAANYQASAIPTLVIIGRKGDIVAYFTGVHDEDTLRAALKKAGL